MVHPIVKEDIGRMTIEMIEAGIEVIFHNKKSVHKPYSDSPTNGYFSDDEMRLILATRKPFGKWFPIFLHEYGHFQQYQAGQFQGPRATRDNCRYWEWLEQGKDLSKEELARLTIFMQEVELDCERRVVQYLLAKEFETGIKVIPYVQRANAYLYFYNVVKKTRRWYKKPPYEVLKIVKLMPTELKDSYTRMPSGYEKLVLEHCIQKEK